MCKHLTYFVPVERVALPATDPKRWLILPVTAIGPFQALKQAEHAVDQMRLHGVAIWAAVRDCPSFIEMQQLRESMDASRERIPRSQRYAHHEVQQVAA